MPKKVTGRFAREMNTESVNYSGPKTRTGARFRGRRRINEPPSEGVGGVYKPHE